MAQGTDRLYSAPAAACAAEILQVLGRADEPLSLTEIERGTTRTKSLVFRALHELERLRFVVRADDRRYRLGIAAFEVGAAYLTQGRFSDAVRDVLRSLADESGESTNLGVLRGAEVLYLMKFEGRSTYVTISHVGGRVPATCTANGKALLARLSPQELRDTVREPLPQMTPYSAQTLTDLERDLEETRQRGYAIDLHEAVVGRGGLAVTIPFPGEDVPHAAISLSIDASRFERHDEERVLAVLLEARERIEREESSRERMHRYGLH